MIFLDLVEIVKGKYKEQSNASGKHQLTTVEDIQQFKSMLMIDKAYLDGFKRTESAAEFFEAYELFDRSFSKILQEDVFYGSKLGYYFEGVPCRLTYLLKKAVVGNPTPSIALQSISMLAWGSFLKAGFLPEGIKIKDVLDAVYGAETVLIDYLQMRVRHEEFSEIYVGNVDRICLLPNRIADTLNIEDLQEIRYVPKVGVCVGKEPLRTFGGCNGLTLDEFDLRYVE